MILLFAAFAITLTSSTTRLVQLSSVCVRSTTSTLAAASLHERCRERSRRVCVPPSSRQAETRDACCRARYRHAVASNRSGSHGDKLQRFQNWNRLDYQVDCQPQYPACNGLSGPRQIKTRMARIAATSKSHRARLALRSL